MTSEEIHRLWRARPFIPFRMHLADGRSVSVRHPEAMLMGPRSRLAVVLTPDNVFDHVDLLLVTDVVVGAEVGDEAA
jgi:hypothetical protein